MEKLVPYIRHPLRCDIRNFSESLNRVPASGLVRIRLPGNDRPLEVAGASMCCCSLLAEFTCQAREEPTVHTVVDSMG